MCNIDPSGLAKMGTAQKLLFCAREGVCLTALGEVGAGIAIGALRIGGLAGCAIAGPAYPECEVVVQGLLTTAHQTMAIAIAAAGAVYFATCMSEDCPEPYCKEALESLKKEIDSLEDQFAKKIDDAISKWRKGRK
jgi:hypothetical protein